MLTGSQNPIIELFNQITEGIQIVNCDVYEKHGWEFIYHKDGVWIFYQNLKNEKFWCNYYKYWSFFESQLGLTYVEVQSITKLLVEETLKREVASPLCNFHAYQQVVEEALKREVAPPKIDVALGCEQVEEALKREVVTPYLKKGLHTFQVEEALKREVALPKSPEFLKLSLVEEALEREVAPPGISGVIPNKKVEEALKRETK